MKKTIKIMYQMLKIIMKVLNSFIEYLDNYINNWEMKDIGKYNIYYMVKNY